MILCPEGGWKVSGILARAAQHRILVPTKSATVLLAACFGDESAFRLTDEPGPSSCRGHTGNEGFPLHQLSHHNLRVKGRCPWMPPFAFAQGRKQVGVNGVEQDQDGTLTSSANCASDRLDRRDLPSRLF